jgi:hypothetical protein
MSLGASRGSILLLVGLAFLIGGGVGAIANHMLGCKECRDPSWSRHGKTWEEDQADKLTKALNLDKTQRATLIATITEMKPRYGEVYSATRSQRRGVDREFQEKLKLLLAPAQKAKLEELIARDEARRREYYGRSQAPATAGGPSAPLGEDEENGLPASQ